MDIAPTILSAAGRKAPLSWPGIDVRDAKKLAARRMLFGANFMHTSIGIANPAANLKYRWAIRDNWKLILPFEPNLSRPIWEGRPETAWGIEPELYNLAADPGEKQNLAAQRRDLVAPLTNAINGWWSVALVILPRVDREGNTCIEDCRRASFAACDPQKGPSPTAQAGTGDSYALRNSRWYLVRKELGLSLSKLAALKARRF